MHAQSMVGVASVLDLVFKKLEPMLLTDLHGCVVQGELAGQLSENDLKYNAHY